MGGGGGLGQIITLGAIIYTGGAAAGLWGTEAAVGAGLADVASVSPWAADAAAGLGWEGAAAGAAGASAGGEWVTDPTTGMETWSGDATAGLDAASGLDTSITELGNGQWDLPDWASNSVDKMGFNEYIPEAAKESANSFSNLGDISSGNPIGSITNNSPISINNQLLNPSSDTFGTQTNALGTSSGVPEATGSDLSTLGDGVTQTPPQSPTLEGITSEGGNAGQGISANGGNQGFQPQKYTYENKDFLTGKTGTGMTADVSELAPNFKQGLEMNNLPDIFKKANTPLWNSGSNVFKAPTPLGMAGRGLSALFDVNANKDAMRLYQEQMSRMSGAEGSNAARGTAANNMWTENFQSPTAGYDEYMRGAGRDLVGTMRATAAKTGNRGSYLNSGKFNSDLQAAYLKNQNARGGAIAQGFNKDPYSASTSLTPGLAQMTRNKYAPIGQAVANIDRSFSLNDLFGND